MLTKFVHRFGKLSTFVFYLTRCLYDLLVKYLVAISEVCHPRAEDHRVLIHVHPHIALLCHQLNYRLAILSLLEHFIGFLKLFQVSNLQEVVQAYR